MTPEGLRLVGDIAGPSDAPLVVLLHGGGQTRHAWAGAKRILAGQGYRVLCYDARGHGDSDWSPQGDYSLDRLAADLRAVLRGETSPVALVGASMGGLTSFYAVASSSEPIAAALVMVDIAIRPAPAGVKKIRAFMTANPDGFSSLDEAAAAVVSYNPHRRRSKDPSGLLKNLRRRADGRLHWHWDPRFIDLGATRQMHADAAGLVDMSANVTLPTMLVRAEFSDIVDDNGVAEMLRLVPQTELFDVKGAGHMVAGDKNDAFTAGIAAFLQRHLPLPAGPAQSI